MTMVGKLYIDDNDAFTAYGIFVQNGGYSGVVQWPSLKAVDTNDWPEEDGIDPDLSDPRLDSKEFSISFCCVDHDKTILLFQTLTDEAYHTFDFRDIGVKKELRLVSQPNVNTISPLQVFDLQLADDNYLKWFEYDTLIPIPSCTQRGFQIDTIDLSEYGVWLTAGTLDQVLKAPAVKPNLKVSTKTIKGSIYEDSSVQFQSKDVVMKCTLISPSLEVFWNNYYSLLYDLTQPYNRDVYMEDSGELFEAYYKSSRVSRFTVSDSGVWCEFDITLCLLSARPGQVAYLLAAEDGDLIITEDSDDNYNVFIDISHENI